MDAKHGRKPGSWAQDASREQVVKESLSSPRRPNPSSETFVEVVVVVHLPVGGRVNAHLKRYPDPILKALKKQGSNLTIKGKQ